MIAYASRTGTQRNLRALRAAGWRLMVSAAGVLRTEGFRYALDNGAWSAFTRGASFDDALFTAALDRLGRDSDWVVVPDIVGGGVRSLDLSLAWLPRVLDAAPAAMLAVQDGLTEGDVRMLLGRRIGIFVGGTTGWKLRTLGDWARLGRDVGCLVHVGRVNSARRIAACALAGATSFDGSGPSRYAKALPRLDAARRQLAMRPDVFQ